MKVSLIALFVLLAAALAQSQSPDDPSRGFRPVAVRTDSTGKLRTGKNYALIIATDDYDDKSWPHLQNPVNDARTIANELKTNYGYAEPDLLLNPTLDDVSAKLASYLDSKFDPGDSLLIFFAGHGKFDEKLKRGYLVFRNSKHVDPLNRSYLSHSDLSNTVDAIACNRILLVIDACFGGTFDNQIALRGPDDLAYPEASKAEIVARKSGLTTRLFLTSGGKEYVQDGRAGAHSPFASEILRALRTYGGDSGLVTFQDLFQQVDKVTTNNPQYGWFGQAEPGSDFWFARDPASAPVVSGISSVSYDSAADRDVLPFLEHGKWGLVNRQGMVILKPVYDLLRPFSEKLAVASSNNKYGAIDLRGKIVLPFVFAELGDMREGLAPACREAGKCGFVDHAGNFVVQPIYKSISHFSNGLAHVVDAAGPARFIDRTGRQVFEAVKTQNFFSEDRVGAWDENNRYGFRNKSGDWVIQPRFEMVGSFSQGLAPVKIGGKWEFIDISGRVQFSSDAEALHSASPPIDPLIGAKRQGKWGFIDHSGKWIIQPSFNGVTWGFLNGVAQVTVAEGWGWIDRSGNWVVRPGSSSVSSDPSREISANRIGSSPVAPGSGSNAKSPGIRKPYP
jgi:Caspase domain/WG containing repeat